MNDMYQNSSRDKLLLHALQFGMEEPSEAEGPHFVDDDELLLAWSLGELSDDTREALVEHMTECASCRREVAAMVKAGVLVFPEVTDDEHDVQPAGGSEPALEPVEPSPVVGQKPKSTWRAWLSLIATVAAIVLIALNLPVIRPTQGPLELVRRELGAGRPEAALTLVESFLDGMGQQDTQKRPVAEELLRQAGYQTALAHLSNRSFQKVLDVEHRISSRVGASAGLLNLKLQAERGVPGESSLAMNDALTDYGYELGGLTLDKGFPTVDETTERLRAEFAQAIEDHPGDVALRLNYGQFLLEQSLSDQAEEQFAVVRTLDKQNPLGYVGGGLVAFERGEFAEALNQFDSAIQIDEDQTGAHINAAMCLEKLQRNSEARGHWQAASRLTTDLNLRRQIAARLSETP